VSTLIPQAVVLLMLGMFISATGCVRAIQERFYTLSDPIPDGRENAPIENDFVEILPVFLPEVLDRPQVVLYDEASRARILEEERWAAPLKSEIRQSIGEKVRHLLGMIDVYHVTPDQGESAKSKTYCVVISVESLKVALGHEATLQAAWTVYSIGESQGLVCRVAYRTELDDQSVNSAVLAYRKAIDALGTHVANSIRELAWGPRNTGAEQGECIPR
jgi:uncharacterized protein